MATLIELARLELGTHENPLGSNLGAGIRKYKACTWLSPDLAWPWCVAFWQWTIKSAYGKQFPYATAAVEQLEAYARQHSLTTNSPKVGDAACFHGEHITFLDNLPVGGYFTGLGGNQGNMVKRSTYRTASVSTYISSEKVRVYLGVKKPVVPPKPKFEVVRGEGGQHERVVLTGSLAKATAKAKSLLRQGAWGVQIRKVPKKR